MGLFGRKAQPLPGLISPEQLLRDAKKGIVTAREQLIQQFTPFCLRIASSACGRFVNLHQDDEASIALIAFNEAIDAYQPEKGASFLTFAEILIRRRLIDFFRRQNKDRSVPFSSILPDEAEGNDQKQVEIAKEAVRIYEQQMETIERRVEIQEYARALEEFKINLFDLPDLTPKHGDAKKRIFSIAQMIANNPSWCQYLSENKELPLKQILLFCDLSRKTLERNRKYIIALVLAMKGDYPFLQSYLGGEGGLIP